MSKKIGENSFIGGTVIDKVYPNLIEIGDHCIITNSALLAHDSLGLNQDGLQKIGKVIIGNRVSIGYGSVILPGVVIGDRAIIAAGSVVLSGTIIPPEEIWGGNPARKIGALSLYLASRREALLTSGPRVAELGIDSVPGDVQTRSSLENLAPAETIVVAHSGPFRIFSETE